MSKDSAAALAQASETPRMALAPSRLLFAVPSRSIMVWSICTCCSTAMSLNASKISPLTASTALQPHVDFDRGIAAAVENFAADDVDDGGHGCLFERT